MRKEMPTTFQPGLCDKSFSFGRLDKDGVPENPSGIYKARGQQGENNMGKLTMQLAKFMTKECGWTLQICDGGNLGPLGSELLPAIPTNDT